MVPEEHMQMVLRFMGYFLGFRVVQQGRSSISAPTGYRFVCFRVRPIWL